MGSQFRGDLWQAKPGQLIKGPKKKKFLFVGKSFEKAIPRNLNSQEIFDFILSILIEHSRTDYPKSVFDLKSLKVIGQFVNWVELAHKLNSFTFTEHRNRYFEDE